VACKTCWVSNWDCRCLWRRHNVLQASVALNPKSLQQKAFWGGRWLAGWFLRGCLGLLVFFFWKWKWEVGECCHLKSWYNSAFCIFFLKRYMLTPGCMSVTSRSPTEGQRGTPVPSLHTVVLCFVAWRTDLKGCFVARFPRICAWAWQLKESPRNTDCAVPKLLTSLQSLRQPRRAGFEVGHLHLVNDGLLSGVAVVLYLPCRDDSGLKVAKFLVLEFASLATVSPGEAKSDCFTWKPWFVGSSAGAAVRGRVPGQCWCGGTGHLSWWPGVQGQPLSAAFAWGEMWLLKTGLLEPFCWRALVVTCDGWRSCREWCSQRWEGRTGRCRADLLGIPRRGNSRRPGGRGRGGRPAPWRAPLRTGAARAERKGWAEEGETRWGEAGCRACAAAGERVLPTRGCGGRAGAAGSPRPRWERARRERAPCPGRGCWRAPGSPGSPARPVGGVTSSSPPSVSWHHFIHQSFGGGKKKKATTQPKPKRNPPSLHAAHAGPSVPLWPRGRAGSGRGCGAGAGPRPSARRAWCGETRGERGAMRPPASHVPRGGTGRPCGRAWGRGGARPAGESSPRGAFAAAGRSCPMGLLPPAATDLMRTGAFLTWAFSPGSGGLFPWSWPGRPHRSPPHGGKLRRPGNCYLLLGKVGSD